MEEIFLAPYTLQEPNLRRVDWISLVYWLLKSIDLTCDLSMFALQRLRRQERWEWRCHIGGGLLGETEKHTLKVEGLLRALIPEEAQPQEAEVIMV